MAELAADDRQHPLPDRGGPPGGGRPGGHHPRPEGEAGGSAPAARQARGRDAEAPGSSSCGGSSRSPGARPRPPPLAPSTGPGAGQAELTRSTASSVTSSARGRHPVRSTTAACAGRCRPRHPGVRLHRLRLGAAARAAAPTSIGASTSWRRRARAIHASGDGVVVFVGYNPWDPPARSRLDRDHRPLGRPRRPGTPTCSRRKPSGICQGARVDAGDVVGWEGNTGNSTGAHLHWAVQFKDDFANPRAVPLIRLRRCGRDDGRRQRGSIVS